MGVRIAVALSIALAVSLGAATTRNPNKHSGGHASSPAPPLPVMGDPEPASVQHDDTTPLMLAAKFGRAAEVEALLRGGANVNERAHDNWTALAWAACSDAPDIARRLLEAGAEVGGGPSYWGTDFHMAAAHDDTELVALFLPHITDIDVRATGLGNRTPLHIAAERGNAHVVAQLLAAGASPSAQMEHDWTPLHVAAICGQARVIEVLLDRRYAIAIDARDSMGSTALELAAGQGQTRAVECLLSFDYRNAPNSVLRDRHGWSALHYAVGSGEVDCARFLARRETVAATTELGRTALHLAAARGDQSLIECLLAEGSNPNARDRFGMTAAELLAETRRARTMGSLAASAVEPISNLSGAPPNSDAKGSTLRFSIVQRPNYSLRPKSGVQLAIWTDGAVLFAPDPQNPGNDLRVGSIDEREVDRFTLELEESNLFELRAPAGSQDSGSIELRFDPAGTSLTRSWDEYPRRELWIIDGPLADELVFARAWRIVRREAERMIPRESRPLASATPNGEFRGFRNGD